MKAIQRREYGAPTDVLQLSDVDEPAVRDDQLLIRVRAASVNSGDTAIVLGTPYLIRAAYGLRRPRAHVIGQDVAGRVEAVGSEVSRFQVGDGVFGGGFGTFAELATAPEKRVALKPAGVSFEQAAALPVAGLTALQGIRDAGLVEPGQKVLINGASGGVGTFAVQAAKQLGAQVTAVCSSRNVEQALTLGADRVIDYTKEDFTNLGEKWDVIFDNAASQTLAATRSVLTPTGILVPNNGNLQSRWLASLPRMLGSVITTMFSGRRARLHSQRWSADDLSELARMVETGEVTPAIERTYPLADAAEAVAYVATGHARGKVVITI